MNPRGVLFPSRFTPSLLTPAVLEELFVQRGALLQRIERQVIASATTLAKHQILLLGPRGIGKTHLLALAYHRLRARAELRPRLCLAWLREEEWGVDSFAELLRRVLLALDREEPQAKLRERIRALREVPRATVAQGALRLLLEHLRDRALLLLCENLDDLFHGLGEQGQRELRAFLQEQQVCSLLCTAPSLFDGVSLQTAPFYGFFRTERLEGLSVDDAAELVRRLATHVGDAELVEYLDTSEGRARLRVIQHLSGGNHRVYVMLSQFLTRQRIDELVPPLLDLLDALTPYYQSRMQLLDASQRKLVEALCERRGAAAAGELAKDCFLDEAEALRWLRDLAGKGYVSLRGSHEEPLFELQEPLLRLSLAVKAEREEPLRLLVEFLRLWYTRSELERRLTTMEPTALERRYIQVALAGPDPVPELIAACERDAGIHIDAGNYDQALRAAEDLLAIDGRSTVGWAGKITSLHGLGKREQELEACARWIEVAEDPHATVAQMLHASLLAELERWEDALAGWRALTARLPKFAKGFVEQARCLTFLRRWRESEAAAREALRLEPQSTIAKIWVASSLVNQRRYGEAAEFIGAHGLEQLEDADALEVSAVIRIQSRQLPEAASLLERALSLDASRLSTLVLRAEVALDQGDLTRAGAVLDLADALQPIHGHLLLVHARLCISIGDFSGAHDYLRQAMEPASGSADDPLAWQVAACLALHQGNFPEALQHLQRILKLEPAGPERQWALAQSGLVLLAMGHLQEAEASLRQALALHPKDSMSLNNLAALLLIAGRSEDAEAHLRRAVDANPKAVDALKNLGELLSVRGNHHDASQLLERATGLAPERGDLWGEYGLIQTRIGNLARASELFRYGQARGDQSPVTRYTAIGVAIALRRWPEAVASLRQALPTLIALEIDAFQAVLRHLLQARLEWPARVRKLVVLFRRAERLPLLAQALSRSIPQLRDLATTDRQRWLEAWQAAADREVAMLPALRLLDTAVSYLASPGPRPLLRLPPEERALLLPLLQLEQDPTVPSSPPPPAE